MRTHELVSIDHLNTGFNEPHEYVLAAVTPEGILVQRAGCNDLIAEKVKWIISQANDLEDQA